jgi:transposase-like protein
MPKQPAPKAKPAVAKDRGRHTLYKPEFNEEARLLCLATGATDADLAKHFGVGLRTLAGWKQRHPHFMRALKEGKIRADMAVANAMYSMAVGFTQTVEKAFATERGVEIVKVEQYFAPNHVAGIFWLKNRQTTHWRDKHEVLHSQSLSLPERAELDEIYRRAEAKSKEQREAVEGREERLRLIQGGKASEFGGGDGKKA